MRSSSRPFSRVTVMLVVVLVAAATGSVSPVNAAPSPPASPVNATNVNGWTPGAYVPITPTRVFDSRVDDGGACISTPRTVTIPNLSPHTAAVTLNVTVTRAARPGHLSVTPGGTPAAGTSNLNYTPGQTVPNAVTVATGPGATASEGTVTLTASAGCPHVIIDQVGANSTGPARAGGYSPATPTRVFDSRVDDGGACITTPRTITFTDMPDDTAAVTLNVTATRATRPGHLTVTPGDTPAAGTSNLNYPAGQTVPNAVTVATAPGATPTERTITLTASTGCPHVLVDLAGTHTAGPANPGGFTAVSPTRVFDSRVDDGGDCINGPRTIAIPDLSERTGAVTLNVTATRAARPGHLTVAPAGTDVTGTSSLNYQSGQTVPNAVTTATGPADSITITASTGCPHVVIDLAGHTRGTPHDITPAVDVEASNAAACAVLATGAVACWGAPDLFYDGDDAAQPDPSLVEGLHDVVEVTVGWSHACARRVNGTVACWGDNSKGQLGAGDLSPHEGLVEVEGLTDVVELDSEYLTTCAVHLDGTVSCWGHADAVGVDGVGAVPTPQQIAGVAGARSVTTWSFGACALSSLGEVACWGYPIDGEWGDLEAPGPVDGLGGQIVVGIEAGWMHMCALMADGTVRCWGANDWGQLGDGTQANRLDAVPVVGASGVTQIDSGDHGTCGRRHDGTALCWGHGLIDLGSTDLIARQVPYLNGTTSLAVGMGACARRVDSTLHCWGPNEIGQLGDLTLLDRTGPVQVQIRPG